MQLLTHCADSEFQLSTTLLLKTNFLIPKQNLLLNRQTQFMIHVYCSALSLLRLLCLVYIFLVFWYTYHVLIFAKYYH